MPRRMYTAIRSTINARSRRIDPRFSGGITLRIALIGGSVVAYTTSRPAATSPDGRQLRASTITQSTTNRAKSSTRKTSRTDERMFQKRATVLARPRAPGGAGPVLPPASGLGGETALAAPRLVLGRHVDVPRAEQEHLVRDALDATAQPERQTRSEVDEPLGVGVVHLGEVHDHRLAVAEALADLAGLVVRARVQRGDPVGLRRRSGSGRRRE